MTDALPPVADHHGMRGVSVAITDGPARMGGTVLCVTGPESR